MGLATSGEKGIWAATVYYAYDEKFNLYFFSNPETVHCLNIAVNPQVAVTIHQQQHGAWSVRGIQYKGTAKRIGADKKSAEYKIYQKRYLWARMFGDHEVYQIVPDEVWYLDNKLLGHHFRIKVI